jgi:TPR repeat protein
LITPHLTLDTDLGLNDAEYLARECERSLIAFDALVLPMLERPRGRLRVVIFGRFNDYDALGPPASSGVFVATTADGEFAPTIFVPAGRDRARTMRYFQHELAHRYIGHGIPQAPTWLNEGLASFLSTVHVGSDDVRLGGSALLLSRTNLTALMAGNYASFHKLGESDANYDLARMFIEFLWFESHDRFASFLVAMKSGILVDAAWRRSFPEPPEKLQERFRRWYDQARRDVLQRSFRVERYSWRGSSPSPPSSVRLLSMSEVLLLKAQLAAEQSNGGARARGFEYALTAIAADLFNSEAYYWAGILAPYDSRDESDDIALSIALALRPDDVRVVARLAWLKLFRRKQVDDFSTVEPLVAQIWPRTSLVVPLMTLMAYAQARGRNDEALAFGRRILASSPECSSCRLAIANLLNVTGHEREAEEELARARWLVRELLPSTEEELHKAFARAREGVKECARSEPIGCEKLGTAYLEGRGAPRDPPRGLALLERACDQRVWHACVPVAAALRFGWNRPANRERSVAILQRACDGGDWPACNDLGDAYEKGSGVTVDLNRSVKFYGIACDHDEPWGCLSLAEVSWVGTGLAYDSQRLIGLLRHAAQFSKQLVAQECV